MPDPTPTPEHPTFNELRKQVEEMALRLKRIEDRKVLTPEDFFGEKPIYHVHFDKYFKFQLDDGKLAVILNTDQLKKDLAGGGLGGPGILIYRGTLRIDPGDETATGIVDARANPVQWVYIGTELQAVKNAGYGVPAWIDLAGGYVGTVRNKCENGNTGIGVQDNGVDFDAADWPGTYKMQPIRGIMDFELRMDVNGAVEAWVDRCNAVDGVCSS